MAMTTMILKVFPELVCGPDGTFFEARVCGRPTGSGQWEGWIEFTSMKTATVLRSMRETTQPNLRNLDWWAEGLTSVYLDGALKRTLERHRPRHRTGPFKRAPKQEAFYPGPAPGFERGGRISPDDAPVNPTLLYHRGENVLRERLEALPSSELAAVVRAYRLADDAGVDADTLSSGALIELIVGTVKGRTKREKRSG